jgi:hypothetical protein
VDRPTSRRGRRGSSAESVSVADLLARATPAEQAVVSAIQERAAAEASAKAAEEARDRTDSTGELPEQGEQAPAADAPRVSRLLTKTIIVATAAMLLCGAATVFSVLTTVGPPQLSPSTPTVGPAKITGPAVVRPDVLNRQLAAGLPTTTRLDGIPATAEGLVAGADMRAKPLGEPARAGGTGAASPRAEEVRRVILEFYAAAPETPEDPEDPKAPDPQALAFELLGPELRGDGLAGFKKSWETKDRTTKLLVQIPHLVIGHGGVAHLTVLIAWPDATVLWVEQLLVVSEGPNPKIVQAELFSAHRG